MLCVEMQDWHPHGLALLDDDLLVSCIDYKPDGDINEAPFSFLQVFSPSLLGLYAPCGAECLNPALMLADVQKKSTAKSEREQKESFELCSVYAAELEHVHLFAAAGQTSQLLVAIERDSQLCITLFDIQ